MKRPWESKLILRSGDAALVENLIEKLNKLVSKIRDACGGIKLTINMGQEEDDTL